MGSVLGAVFAVLQQLREAEFALTLAGCVLGWRQLDVPYGQGFEVFGGTRPETEQKWGN